MIVIMLGAPGTGKGTVGKLLSEALGIVHISSGEIFRSYVKKQNELGKEIEEYIQKGVLVPDELAIKLLENRLKEPDVKKGVILDGYPRTREQAVQLDKLLEKQEKKVNIAVNLSLSDKDIIDRITKRRTCPNPHCREIYNTEFKPPKKEGICDKCESKLIVREDDNEETIKNRLITYHEFSENLIDFYKNKDILYTVKVNIHSENTSQNIAEEIENYLKQN